MADIDTLPLKAVPRMALVDANGIATNGSKTVLQLAQAGMQAICAVDGSGNATTGTGTLLQLAQRGIRAFCPVDETGVATDASTALQLRQRGIRPMVLLNNSGVALTGSASMLQLAQRGLPYFCPTDESGNATTMGAVIVVSNTTVLESATIGTTVGTLSVAGGTGTYTFTLTVNPGSKFITAGTNGVNLNVNGALDYETATSHTITISATNGVTPVTRSVTITVVNVVEDTTPNAFTFTDVTGATLSTLYESNTITVAGMDGPASVSITGGEYSKNGGAYTSSAGSASVGDTFNVRATSSLSSLTPVNVVLTIGGTSDTFTVTTAEVNVAPTVANAIPNQTATDASAFSFAFAANTFADANVGDTKTYTSSLSPSGSLPSWLAFTPGTRTFSGMPTSGDIGTLSLRVTCTDSGGLSVFDDFDIVVSAASLMPAGLIGQWYAGDYDATKQAIPNRIAGSSPRFDYMRGGQRGVAANIGGFVNLGVTVTPGQTDGLGGSTAVRMEGGPSAFWGLPSTTTYAGGTKTAFIEAKSNTAGTQNLRLLMASYGNFVNWSVTTSWTRIAIPFPDAGAYGLYPVASDGTNTFDILVRDLSVVNGSTDPGKETLAGHMYLGKSLGVLAPTVSGGIVDHLGTGYGVAQFASMTAYSEFTIVAIAERSSSANATFNALLSEAGAFSTLTFGIDQTIESGARAFPLFYTPAGGSTQPAGLFYLKNAGFHFIAGRYSASAAEGWVDGGKAPPQGGAGTATLGNLMVGLTNTEGNISSARWKAIGFFNRALTNAEVLVAKTAFQTLTSTTPSTFARFLVAEGDSITAGASTTTGGYASRYILGASPIVFGWNAAVSGSVVANMTARAPDNKVMADGLAPTKRILSVLIGANDVSAAPAATFLNTLSAYCDARRAEGWIVCLATVLPRGDAAAISGSHATKRATINPEIKLWTVNGSLNPGKHADYIIDFTTDATMNNDATATNPTYYDAAAIHPIDAGHALLQPIYNAVINASP